MYYIIPAIQNIWTHFLCFCYKTWNASSLIRFIQNKYLRRVLQFKPHRDDQKYRIFPAYRTHIINHTRTAHNSIVLNSAPQFVDYMRLCGDNAPFWWDSIFIIITSCRWDLMCEGYVSFLRLVLGFGYLSRINVAVEKWLSVYFKMEGRSSTLSECCGVPAHSFGNWYFERSHRLWYERRAKWDKCVCAIGLWFGFGVFVWLFNRRVNIALQSVRCTSRAE